MYPEDKIKEQVKKLKFEGSMEGSFLNSIKKGDVDKLKLSSILLAIINIVFIIADFNISSLFGFRVIFLRIGTLGLFGFTIALLFKPQLLPKQNREFWCAQSAAVWAFVHSWTLGFSPPSPYISTAYIIGHIFVMLASAVSYRSLYYMIVAGVSLVAYNLFAILGAQLLQSDNSIYYKINNIILLVISLFGLLSSYWLEASVRKDFAQEDRVANVEKKQEYILHKILPENIAKKIEKELGRVSNAFETTTVLFAEITGFTQLAQNVPQSILTSYLQEFDEAFSLLAQKYGVEYIRSEGDFGPFWLITGLPEYKYGHAEQMAEMALSMRDTVIKIGKKTDKSFQIRIGMNSGPLVACWFGNEGLFVYDLYGDTLRVGKAMEQQGITGQIQVSETTYNLLKEKYYLDFRCEFTVSSKLIVKAYILRTKL